jgi:3' terminal RNA ribose 2'-O-methyltransferase Hen1
MLLTISTTHRPATDLGFLLHKNPARHHEFEMTFGKAHVFYPQATEEVCTAALLVEVDPVGLVRGKGSHDTGPLAQYVNDRPYTASSLLSVALGDVFSTAMGGRSKERQDIAEKEIPLEVSIPVINSKGGEDVIRRLFEPLGYEVTADNLPLDDSFPEWGPSSYYAVKLSCNKRLKDVLEHVYVLIPVMDASKHYYVGEDEVEKLLRRAGDWLPNHPARELIVSRYLRNQKHLTRQALERLSEDEGIDPDEVAEEHNKEEVRLEERISLHQQRLGAVLGAIRSAGARKVLDLGCGEGRLVELLLKEKTIDSIVAVDVSYRTLEIASRRLRLDRMPQRQKARLQLLYSSLTYRDARFEGFDAAALVEVIEHLDPQRLNALERVVFEFAKPRVVVITTPNAEYNVRFEGMAPGQLRHRDHRFEWTRAQFQAWSEEVAARFGYGVRFLPVGDEDATLGAPSQMAVFS